MTDLLTPDDVREIQKRADHTATRRFRLPRLCRDYLTLWDELEHEQELSDKAVKRVTELEEALRFQKEGPLR